MILLNSNHLRFDSGGPQPAVLQEVNIPIWSNTDCRLKYGPAAPGGIVEHMLCAGQASRDSCSVSIYHFEHHTRKIVNRCIDFDGKVEHVCCLHLF